jgi:hypothetical protein
MVFLALGICGDFWIVARITGLGNPLSTGLALGLLVFFLGAWFGYSYWNKRQVHDRRLTESHLKQQRVA